MPIERIKNSIIKEKSDEKIKYELNKEKMISVNKSSSRNSLEESKSEKNEQVKNTYSKYRNGNEELIK